MAMCIVQLVYNINAPERFLTQIESNSPNSGLYSM